MKRTGWLFILLLSSPAVAEPVVEPGQRPPSAIAEQTRPALEKAKQALLAQDAAAVRAAVKEAVTALGPWAGNPETATRYYGEVHARTLAGDELAKALRGQWRREWRRYEPRLPWRSNPEGDPRKMTAGLRAAAWPLDAAARVALLLPEERDALTAEVKAGAAWLLKCQHAGGGFPFPAGPGLQPQDKVGRIVAKALEEHPDLAKDGWISDLRGDGGLQFDNGLCGHALLSAWILTGDPACMAAAKRAGDWAVRQPLVLNWNYNAFSAGFLARLGSLSGEGRYLDAAVKKTETGVLPGQLPGGRWFDAHNACAVYHNILLRELLHVHAALPEAHPFRPVVRDALVRGLDQAAQETTENGYTGTWTDNFAAALVQLGDSPKWTAALQACLNRAGWLEAPGLGFYIVPVLEWSARR